MDQRLNIRHDGYGVPRGLTVDRGAAGGGPAPAAAVTDLDGSSVGAAHARTDLPPVQGSASGLMVMALRAAEQHVLVVVGEADLHTAEHLRSRLIELLPVRPPTVLVELGALSFCDLAGLDALHDAARAAHRLGVSMTFRGMSSHLSWLDRTFPPRRPPTPPGATSLGPVGARGLPQPPVGGLSGAPDETAPGSAAGATDHVGKRGGGRRSTPDDLVHAVPRSDTTRSAVCGARTWQVVTAWTGTSPADCPDCAAAVSASSPGGFPPSAASRAGRRHDGPREVGAQRVGPHDVQRQARWAS